MYLEPALKRSAKKAVVPDTVKIGKKTYKITAIAGNAFTGYDNLRQVKIGKNVKKIGKYAFGGCSRLMELRVKSRKLTAEGVKDSLAGPNVKKVVIFKHARDKYPLYKKIFAKMNTDADKELTVIKKK